MIKKIFLVILVIFLLITGLIWFWWQNANQPIGSSQAETIFVIKKGQSVSKTAELLKKHNLIKSPLAFKLMVWNLGLSRQIQAGTFRLSPSMSLKTLSQSLTHGTLDFWVTIPEGKRVEEVATIIKDSAIESNSQFDSGEFIRQAKPLEGRLFPDSYLIPQDADARQVVEILNQNFEKKYRTIKNKTILNKQELIILASLIEREAKHEEDRRLVSGVILNRLKADWPLQIDATVQYFLGYQADQSSWWRKNLSKADLQTQSPYNTYQNTGLPPGPICNPGLDSLKAAANPTQTEYWFYLTDPSGKTHFSKTNEEHSRKVNLYLR